MFIKNTSEQQIEDQKFNCHEPTEKAEFDFQKNGAKDDAMNQYKSYLNTPIRVGTVEELNKLNTLVDNQELFEPFKIVAANWHFKQLASELLEEAFKILDTTKRVENQVDKPLSNFKRIKAKAKPILEDQILRQEHGKIKAKCAKMKARIVSVVDKWTTDKRAWAEFKHKKRIYEVLEVLSVHSWEIVDWMDKICNLAEIYNQNAAILIKSDREMNIVHAENVARMIMKSLLFRNFLCNDSDNLKANAKPRLEKLMGSVELMQLEEKFPEILRIEFMSQTTLLNSYQQMLSIKFGGKIPLKQLETELRTWKMRKCETMEQQHQTISHYVNKELGKQYMEEILELLESDKREQILHILAKNGAKTNLIGIFGIKYFEALDEGGHLKEIFPSNGFQNNVTLWEHYEKAIITYDNSSILGVKNRISADLFVFLRWLHQQIFVNLNMQILWDKINKYFDMEYDSLFAEDEQLNWEQSLKVKALMQTLHTKEMIALIEQEYFRNKYNKVLSHHSDRLDQFVDKDKFIEEVEKINKIKSNKVQKIDDRVEEPYGCPHKSRTREELASIDKANNEVNEHLLTSFVGYLKLNDAEEGNLSVKRRKIRICQAYHTFEYTTSRVLLVQSDVIKWRKETMLYEGFIDDKELHSINFDKFHLWVKQSKVGAIKEKLPELVGASNLIMLEEQFPEVLEIGLILLKTRPTLYMNLLTYKSHTSEAKMWTSRSVIPIFIQNIHILMHEMKLSKHVDAELYDALNIKSHQTLRYAFKLLAQRQFYGWMGQSMCLLVQFIKLQNSIFSLCKTAKDRINLETIRMWTPNCTTNEAQDKVYRQQNKNMALMHTEELKNNIKNNEELKAFIKDTRGARARIKTLLDKEENLIKLLENCETDIQNPEVFTDKWLLNLYMDFLDNFKTLDEETTLAHILALSYAVWVRWMDGQIAPENPHLPIGLRQIYEQIWKQQRSHFKDIYDDFYDDAIETLKNCQKNGKRFGQMLSGAFI
uniref:Uncharacterized protein n=1 Tax=Globodera rostochiensis TaxID=31243 RepID=A0A914I2U0_GLORO